VENLPDYCRICLAVRGNTVHGPFDVEKSEERAIKRAKSCATRQNERGIHVEQEQFHAINCTVILRSDWRLTDDGRLGEPNRLQRIQVLNADEFFSCLQYFMRVFDGHFNLEAARGFEANQSARKNRVSHLVFSSTSWTDHMHLPTYS
jgi:hypothetical protein